VSFAILLHHVLRPDRHVRDTTSGSHDEELWELGNAPRRQQADDRQRDQRVRNSGRTQRVIAATAITSRTVTITIITMWRCEETETVDGDALARLCTIGGDALAQRVACSSRSSTLSPITPRSTSRANCFSTLRYIVYNGKGGR